MKHPLWHTGEAGIEPALTVLETAFLPLEDSPINMSRRGLLPDPFRAYAPSKPHILCCRLFGSWSLRPPSFYRYESGSLNARFRALGSRSFIARYAHDFMTSVSQMPAAFLLSLRKRVTQRSLRSRFRAFAPQISGPTRPRLHVQARHPLRPILPLSPLLVKPSSD